MGKSLLWSIPSEKEQDLKLLIGSRITDLIKMSDETFTEYIAYLEEIGNENYKDKLSFFKFSFGGLLIQFDSGIQCYFSSAEDLNSIIIAFEADNNDFSGGTEELTHACEVENNPFQNLLNKAIIQINILSRVDLNSKQLSTPSEVGMEFIMADDSKLVLSHNLTENNFVFGVLTEDDIYTSKTAILKSIR